MLNDSVKLRYAKRLTCHWLHTKHLWRRELFLYFHHLLCEPDAPNVGIATVSIEVAPHRLGITIPVKLACYKVN